MLKTISFLSLFFISLIILFHPQRSSFSFLRSPYNSHALSQLFETAQAFFVPSHEFTAHLKDINLSIESDMKRGNVESAFVRTVQLTALLNVYGLNNEFISQQEKRAQVYTTVKKSKDRSIFLLNARDDIFTHLLTARENFVHQSEDISSSVREQIEQKLTQAEQTLMSIGTYVTKDETQSAIDLLEQAEQNIVEAESLLEAYSS